MIYFEVNYLAVIIAAVVSLLFGFLWYGPIFGKAWMRLNGVTKKDIEASKKKGMVFPMFLHLIGNLISVFAFGVLAGSLGLVGIGSYLVLGLILSVGFFLSTTLLGSVLWDNKPWGLYLLNAVYWIINLEIVAIILSLF